MAAGEDGPSFRCSARSRSWGRQGAQGAYSGKLRTATVSQTPQTEEPSRCVLSKLTFVRLNGEVIAWIGLARRAFPLGSIKLDADFGGPAVRRSALDEGLVVSRVRNASWPPKSS
jgi:hypothetical protein